MRAQCRAAILSSTLLGQSVNLRAFRCPPWRYSKISRSALNLYRNGKTCWGIRCPCCRLSSSSGMSFPTYLIGSIVRPKRLHLLQFLLEGRLLILLGTHRQWPQLGTLQYHLNPFALLPLASSASN